MTKSTLNLIILLAGLLGGWASALYSIQSVGSTPVGADKQWRSWDTGSGGEANPYAVAHYMLDGQIPPAEGLFRAYYTETDDAGKPLDPKCLYRVTANAANVRWWSFSAGRQPDNDETLPVTVTSDTVLRDGKGDVVISVSATPKPGNWVSPPSDGKLTLGFLVAHDGKLADEDTRMLPKIEKAGC